MVCINHPVLPFFQSNSETHKYFLLSKYVCIFQPFTCLFFIVHLFLLIRAAPLFPLVRAYPLYILIRTAPLASLRGRAVALSVCSPRLSLVRAFPALLLGGKCFCFQRGGVQATLGTRRSIVSEQLT